MGFVVTTLIFAMVGVIASLMVRICCGRGALANLQLNLATCNSCSCPNVPEGLHLILVITAVVCCWMMWAIVYLAQTKPLIVPILTEGE